MERLWSPWRLAYVTGAAGGKKTGCIFCAAADPDVPAGPDPDGALVVARGRTAYVILNRYPYSNGHVLVTPYRHVASLASASPEELAELIQLTRDAEVAITQAYAPHGINVGINLGRPAGAGILDHLHVHVVPRWDGDTNFMSVVGNVRVLPEELPQTVERLRPIFARLQKESR